MMITMVEQYINNVLVNYLLINISRRIHFIYIYIYIYILLSNNNNYIK